MEHGGTIGDDNIAIFIQGLMTKLRKYGRSHSYLTHDNIVIKRGSFYIYYPPILTKAYLKSLKSDG